MLHIEVFFLEAARDALFKFVSDALRAICQCIASQTQTLSQISSSINTSALFIDVVLHEILAIRSARPRHSHLEEPVRVV